MRVWEGWLICVCLCVLCDLCDVRRGGSACADWRVGGGGKRKKIERCLIGLQECVGMFFIYFSFTLDDGGDVQTRGFIVLRRRNAAG